MKSIQNYLQNLFLVSLLGLLVQCQGEIKKEDLLEKRDEVRKNMADAKEDIDEAVKLKEKYLTQQKEKMIEQLEERQLQVEVEIDKLKEMVNDPKSIADNEINSAIQKYLNEKARIKQKIEDIRNTTDKNWMKASENFEKQIDHFQQSLQDFMQEVEKLEALKADSV